ncbi:MAG: PA2779 family protein [Nitrospirae bacterium]|nr:PA2779 family protein [Nitrospirota bacterium]
MRIPFIKQISWYLVVAMFIIGIAPKVDAGFAPSEIIPYAQADRNSDIDKIQKIIETKAVSTRLLQLGFTTEEVKNRLAQLSDQQLHQVASQLDDLKAGGDVLGVIIALLVIAILVVILLNLTGHKVVITK